MDQRIKVLIKEDMNERIKVLIKESAAARLGLDVKRCGQNIRTALQGKNTELEIQSSFSLQGSDGVRMGVHIYVCIGECM